MGDRASKAIAALLGMGLSGYVQGKVAMANMQSEQARKAQEDAEKRKQNYLDVMFQENLKIRNDPQATPQARQEATDFLNQVSTMIMGQRQAPQAPGPDGQLYDTEPQKPWFSQPAEYVSKPQEEQYFPPYFYQMPPPAQNIWLKQNGYIKDDSIDPVDKQREEYWRIKVNEAKRDYQARSPLVQQQINDLNDEFTRLIREKNAIDVFVNPDTGDRAYANPGRVKDIDMRLKYLETKIQELTRPPTNNQPGNQLGNQKPDYNYINP